MKESREEKRGKLCYEGVAFFEARPIYRIHRVRGENSTIASYAMIFDLKRINREGLSEVFDYNMEVFKSAR